LFLTIQPFAGIDSALSKNVVIIRTKIIQPRLPMVPRNSDNRLVPSIFIDIPFSPNVELTGKHLKDNNMQKDILNTENIKIQKEYCGTCPVE